MNRLLVALLAAVDALVAAAVGVAAALAPLAVLWVVGLGGADWGALWPASARIWQLGHLVPLQISLPADYLNATGIPADAATFWLSLAPLAFAGFTAISAWRCGARAAQAGAWIAGVVAGVLVTAAVAALLWRTSANPVAAVYGWQALLLPTAVFAVPALCGALVGAWRHGDDGPVDAVRDRIAPRWQDVPAAGARGVGIAVAGFLGVGALLVAIAAVLRGGQVIALFEAAHVDATGASMIALGQLAYLPTLVVWGGAFAAGPGFAIGTGTAVSPAGTALGVVPGIPALGIVPDSVSPWLLVTALLIVAVGFVAGAAARLRLVRGVTGAGEDAADAEASARAVALGVIVVGGAAGAALLAALSSGAMGPGRLADVGPAAGAVALTVAVELLVGAAIALFAPARTATERTPPDRTARNRTAQGADTRPRGGPAAWPGDAWEPAPAAPAAAPAPASAGTADGDDTEPFAPSALDPLAGLGGRDDDPRP